MKNVINDIAKKRKQKNPSHVMLDVAIAKNRSIP